MSNSQRQYGVTLIEMILVIGLMGFITMLSFYEKQTDLEQAKARAVGGHIFQYNNAVRNALAQKPPTSTATYTGTAWLKSSACGGVLPPDHEFLPCDFPAATPTNPIPFGKVSFLTTVAVSGTAPNLKFVATTNTSAFTVEGRVRADLSGIAVLSAASAMNSGVKSAAGGGLSPIAGATDSRFSSDALTGVMTFVASNTASNDVWLRTDGSNSMHKPLVFDATDFADRQITGASRIQNIAGQALFLGSGSGLTAVTGAGVVVDSSAEVLGAFRVRDSLVVDGSASVAGNLSVSGEVAAAGSISSSQNITAGGALVGQIFYDSNNMGYYVDPNGTSSLNVISAQGSIDAQGAINSNSTMRANGGISTPAGVSAGGDVNGSRVLAQIYYDSNNTAYYLDGDNTSNLNNLYANYLQSNGRIRGGEFLDLAGVANPGDGCGPNGLVGHDASGGLLSCANGVWSAPGVNVTDPVTIVNIGPIRGKWSGCWTTVRPALITASGPGTTILTVNGATMSTTMGWGGEFSDIGMDFAISGLVPAGGTYCYYVTNNRAYSTSSGIRVMSSSL